MDQSPDVDKHSRGLVLPGSCNFVSPSLTEGAGKAGRRLRPQSRVRECYRNAHGLNYRYSRDIPAFPAQWLYGLYVLSPGKRPFLPPLPAEELPASVAPGSRRQDHTTSPYAAAFSSGANTPDATASIASRTLRIVTIAKRPSVGAG